MPTPEFVGTPDHIEFLSETGAKELLRTLLSEVRAAETDFENASHWFRGQTGNDPIADAYASSAATIRGVRKSIGDF